VVSQLALHVWRAMHARFPGRFQLALTAGVSHLPDDQLESLTHLHALPPHSSLLSFRMKDIATRPFGKGGGERKGLGNSNSFTPVPAGFKSADQLLMTSWSLIGTCLHVLPPHSSRLSLYTVQKHPVCLRVRLPACLVWRTDQHFCLSAVPGGVLLVCAVGHTCCRLTRCPRTPLLL
jgi:hypothetical protein